MSETHLIHLTFSWKRWTLTEFVRLELATNLPFPTHGDIVPFSMTQTRGKWGSNALSRLDFWVVWRSSPVGNSCSKITIETLKQGMIYVES